MFRKFIASQFKKPTGLFGIFTSNLMIKGNTSIYNTLIKNLEVQPHDKLLEIGYGPGLGINLITRACATCTIHGIDFSRLMYKRASRYNKQNIDKGRVQLQYGDFLETPIVSNDYDEDYDKIFCVNVVYFWDELKKPFEKILSLLKKSGAFYIYMAHKDTLIEKKAPDGVFNKYSLEQIGEALRLTGFCEVEHYFDKGYYIKAKK